MLVKTTTFLCLVVYLAHGQNLTLPIECPAFTPTPIIGNPAALEILREWCADDERCAQQYGQLTAPNQPLFNTLFLTTTHTYTGTLFLESPLLEAICNISYVNVNINEWVRTLLIDITERGRSCKEGQTNAIINEDGDIECRDLPWTQCINVNGFNALGLAIVILIFIVGLINIVTQIWIFIRKRSVQIL